MSSDADWQELHFTARKDQVEALEDWLFAHGALSVTLEDEADQPLLEPGPGETPSVGCGKRNRACSPGDQGRGAAFA